MSEADIAVDELFRARAADDVGIRIAFALAVRDRCFPDARPGAGLALCD